MSDTRLNVKSNDTILSIRGTPVPKSTLIGREKMLGRFPNIGTYFMPREVADRADITACAKVVYAFIHSIGSRGVSVYIPEVAGMCGLTALAASKALKELEDAKLLERRANYYNAGGALRRGKTWMRTISPPKRPRKKVVPQFTSTDISDLEEVVNAKLYETET